MPWKATACVWCSLNGYYQSSVLNAYHFCSHQVPAPPDSILSQTQRIARAGQHHWRLPILIPQLRAGQTGEILQDHAQLGSVLPQRWRYRNYTSSEHNLFYFLTTLAKQF